MTATRTTATDLEQIVTDVAAAQGSAPWAVWLAIVLPAYFTAPFADHHRDLWEWVWSIEPDVSPESFVGVWARGGAKSMSAEGACVILGARRQRRYVWYVSGTQELADDHVGSIAAMLESDDVAMWYPSLARRSIGKYGNSKGWRRNRLRTAAGFTVDALGLDTAVRGVKIEEQRPDFLVIDDIDRPYDSPAQVRKKLDTLARDIIPAGANDLAILAIQNLVHPNSVFSMIARGDVDFLARRHVSGPIPALHGMKVERRTIDGDARDVIVAGVPTWEGQDVAVCQAQIDRMGLRAFRTEAQHDVARVEGAYWCQEQLDIGRVTSDAVPTLARVVVAVDPSGGEGAGNDEQGIVVVGKSLDGHGYVLADRTVKLSPAGWGRAAVQAYIDHSADVIVGEVNFGGAMVRSTIEGAAQQLYREGALPSDVVPIEVIVASRGKAVRAEPVAALYGEVERPETWRDARVHHVGGLVELEAEMVGWTPMTRWSPNRMDALVWAVTVLGLGLPVGLPAGTSAGVLRGRG